MNVTFMAISSSVSLTTAKKLGARGPQKYNLAIAAQRSFLNYSSGDGTFNHCKTTRVLRMEDSERVALAVSGRYV